MKKKRKSHMTLIELLISMTLTTIILTTLFFFYQQMTLLNNKFDADQKESFEKSYVENRLSAILPKAVSEKTKEKDFNFFTLPDAHGMFKNNSPSLIFTFDNGVDLDKEFSNHVLGRIYLDQSGELTLAMWPSPVRWSEGGRPPMKKEILMENVDSLDFQFFIPQEKEEQRMTPGQKPGEKVEPFPRLSWTNKWQRNYKELPAIVKIEIKKKNKTLNFAYPLPNVSTPIVYRR